MDGRVLLSTGNPWGRGRGRVSGREGAVIYRYTTGMGEWEGGGHYLQVNHGEEVGGGRVDGRGLLSTGKPWRKR